MRMHFMPAGVRAPSDAACLHISACPSHRFRGPLPHVMLMALTCFMESSLVSHSGLIVLPQPKFWDSPLPVPRGMTATGGGGSKFKFLCAYMQVDCLWTVCSSYFLTW